MMKHFDMFSGYGGFAVAMRNNNINTIGFCEVDKYAISVLKRNFPGVRHYGDVSSINPDDIPDVDIITGGTPCQDLSVAGKRKGITGERSGLFFEFIRVVKAKQPDHFIWENVKGALSSNGGRDFARVFIELSGLGYDLQWQILNTKNFGIPQNRERIFIVGTIAGKSGRQIFPIRTGNEKNNGLNELTKDKSQGYRVCTDECSTTLASQAGGAGAIPIINRKGNIKLQKNINCITSRYNGVFSSDNGSRSHIAVPVVNNKGSIEQKQIINCIDANYAKGLDNHSQRTHIAMPVCSHDYIEKKQNGRSVKDHNDHMFTLTVKDKHGIFDGYKIRRLTPLECERLQGLPDDWTKHGIDENGKEILISDSQRYRMTGNGVTVAVVDAIVKRILKHNEN